VDGLCGICIFKQCWVVVFPRRWYSHDEARDTKARPKDPLKLDLLKLYKRVHPDLFHHSPTQRVLPARLAGYMRTCMARVRV